MTRNELAKSLGYKDDEDMDYWTWQSLIVKGWANGCVTCAKVRLWYRKWFIDERPFHL